MTARRGTVLVTGASSGIGEECVRHLAHLGFRVFAGVRREEDAERLRTTMPVGVEPVRVDVTDAGSVAAAAEQVDAAVGAGGLAGLVNNAGVAVSAPLEYLPPDELRRQLDVNVVGQHAVTQAMLPMIRRARGRIVNMGSIGGRVALPFLGPYAASKFALEALTDSLRRELRPWGIEVAIIEPGGITTPIWEKSGAAADELLAGMPSEAEERYGGPLGEGRKQADRLATEGSPPRLVAQAVAHALTAGRPRTRYLVGRDAKIRAALGRLLPDRVLDRLVARVLKQ